MGNDDSDWNRWRGEQTAILKLMKEELTILHNRLRSMENQFNVMRGKTIAYGAMAGLLVSIGIALLKIWGV